MKKSVIRFSLVLLAAVVGAVVAIQSGVFSHMREKEEIKAAVANYFDTWSAADMDGYKDCFQPWATIYYQGPDGGLQGTTLDPFVESQREAHAQAAAPMNEYPTSIETETDGRVATSFVRWALMTGEKKDTGTDAFTFVKTDQGWKIISLTFNQD
ncbi:MAG: nuclear transport factor 2 family protein [Verrucomicrobiota bacterium]